MQILKLLCCMQDPHQFIVCRWTFPAWSIVAVSVLCRFFLLPVFFVVGCFFDEPSCSCKQDKQGCQQCCGCKGFWAFLLFVASPIPMALLLSGTNALEIWCGLQDVDTMVATTRFPWDTSTDSPATEIYPVFFDILHGDCSLSTFTVVTKDLPNISYSCVQSPNYPLSYSSDQNCAVVLKSRVASSIGEGSLTAVDFKTDPLDQLWMVFDSSEPELHFDDDACSNYNEFLAPAPVDVMTTLVDYRTLSVH